MDKNHLLKLIENLNLQRSVNFVACDPEHDENELNFHGTILMENRQIIKLKISFPKRFPLVLPNFYLIQNDEFRVHIDSNGKICLFDMSSVLIKQNMEEQILIDCYDRAISILNIPIGSSEYYQEFCREFDAYWQSISKKTVYSCISTANIKYENYSILFTQSIPIVAKTKDYAEVMAYNNLRIIRNEFDFDKDCLIIKLRIGSKMLSLKNDYNWNMVRNYILNNVSSSIKRQFRRFLDTNVKKYIKYIFIIYPSEIGDIIWGFHVEFNNIRYTKIANSITAKVEPVYVKRVDYEYLTLRGGSSSNFKEKHILLLGCGSVGGYLANELCQLGILKIDILDKDIFTTENVHRHFLGFDALSAKDSQYKADLVKERLEAMYPYVEIDALHYQERTVEAFLMDEDRLEEYDIIVSALGEPTLNLEINRILYERNFNIPFICCFNEPYGIGGQIIAVNIEQSSCLHCLYTDVLSSDMVSFRGSLVAPNQNFNKNISGCSSAFVPYTCLDSKQTALLSAQMILDVLNKKIERNILNTWIGSSDELISNGYIVSEYYKLNSKSTNISLYNFKNGHCKICNNNQGDIR